MNKHKFKIISIDCCSCRLVDNVKEVEVDIGITGRDLCISALTKTQVYMKEQAESEGDELDNFEFFCTFGWRKDMKEWWYEEGEECSVMIIGEGHPLWDKIDSHENWDDKEQEEFEEWEGNSESAYDSQEFKIV